MKKTLKRILAVLLAALMVFGASAMASADSGFKTANKIRMKYHTFGWFEAFTPKDYPGIGYGFDDTRLAIEHLGGCEFKVDALKRGVTYLNLSEEIGDNLWKPLGSVEIEVYYDFWQWLEVIFLFGWIWLPNTQFKNVGKIA